MANRTKRCRLTGKAFEITPIEDAFYKRIGVPDPDLCPSERERLRTMFRNDHTLHKRNCSKTGKSIISMFDSDVPFPVYDKEVWWGDSWDAKSYGRPFDFSRPFFEQFAELQKCVPHFPLFQIGSQENSAYTHHSVDNKNCYLCYSVINCQDCEYSEYIDACNDCLDCSYITKSEGCYECNSCTLCHDSFFLRDCQETRNSAWGLNLQGCSRCIACVNLSHKDCYILNKKVSSEEFNHTWLALFTGKREILQTWTDRFNAFWPTEPQRGARIINCENAHGDRLKNCKNVTNCFDCYNLEDCHYCTRIMDCKDAFDCFGTYRHEVQYFVVSSEVNFGGFLTYSFGHYDSWYLDQCFYSNNLFGCVGMNKASYCILNQQYSKEDFETTKNKIVEHMIKTGEWGRFFPPSLSAFPYNESTAIAIYPIQSHDAEKYGARWKHEIKDADLNTGDALRGGNSIDSTFEEIGDGILSVVIQCEESGRLFRYTPAELKFYKKNNLPLPLLHPQIRYQKRLSQRNPTEVHFTHCARCKKETLTSFPRGREVRVYCDECYRDEVLA